MAIPSIMRLPAREFRRQGRKSVVTPYFSVKYNALGDKNLRVGIIAGTAVHRSAVKRNFWKRQSGEAIRALGKISGDLVVILSPNVNRLTKKQFQGKLIAAIRAIS